MRRLKLFSQKKRLSFGIDSKPIPVKDVAVYLGDNFHSKGTNTDLVEARVQMGKRCIVNSMALCSDVTMGAHTVGTLLLLYQSLFLPVVLYNSKHGRT